MQGEKRFINLTDKERIWLEKGRKSGKKGTFRQRCHYILLSDQGLTIQQIADIYQVGRQTIAGWFNRFEARGISGLHTGKGKGRPPIVRIDNKTEILRIETLVENSSQNLKPVLVAIEKEFGKTMSKRTLQRLLKKKGWTWKRFRKECPKKPDPEEYKEKCSILNKLTMLFLLGHLDLRYADETAFTLQPNVPYGWIRKGEQVGIPSRKGGNLNVFGLMNLQGELTSYQTTQSVNSQTIIEWLDDFAKTITKMTVVVLDNAPWHVSKVVDDKLKEWEEKGLFIFHLPPYSPHLNLIEILWRKMKLEWLKPENYQSKEALHFGINEILTNYNNEEFKINFDVKQKC